MSGETKEERSTLTYIKLKCKDCGNEFDYDVYTKPQLAFKKENSRVYYHNTDKYVYCDKCNNNNVIIELI